MQLYTQLSGDVMAKIISRIRFIWDLGGTNPFTFFVRVLNEIENRSRFWDVPHKQNQMEGSLSNAPNYLTACRFAVDSNEKFEVFRSCKSYRKILEHVSPRTGEKYLRQLDRRGIPYLTLKNLTSRINVGGPATYSFPGLGKISPTSIRYAKVHNDLRNIFGDLNDLEVLEIGCGYGGLALQLLEGESLGSFSILDLEIVEELAIKYLSNTNSKALNFVQRARNQELKSIDLLISNYAFSELTKDLQDEYFNRYIKKSRMGYMIYNHINPAEFLSYSAHEICKKIPGSELLAEIPQTDQTNVLIVWGHKS
jgi:hypothetical protein